VGVLFTTVSLAWNYDIHCRHTRAHGLPLRGQTIDCGMYPTASASSEHQGTEDSLSVCWGNSGSHVEVPEAKYCCIPSQCRGGASPAAVRLSSDSVADAIGAPISEMATPDLWAGDANTVLAIYHRATLR
jgi:hypothetical protein